MNATYFALRGGLEALQQVAEREPHPGNDHRPGLDAAQAVNALLERVGLRMSSRVNVPVLAASPETVTDQGWGLNFPDRAAGSALSVPNS